MNQPDPSTCSPGYRDLSGQGPQAASNLEWTGMWRGDPSHTSSPNPYVDKETLQPYGAT